ncbi:hypothetical protein [Lysobacter sp. CA199]|uniref:hypothetical protein n=1 Tax=Lysobacter sp. CA199 TaxID=3455608 RepID=UPI003F8D8CCD
MAISATNADAGEPVCFWTDLQGATQECETPLPPSDWTASGTNGHIFFASPNTVGNPVQTPIGNEEPPVGFRAIVGLGHTLQTEVNGEFYNAYGANPERYTGLFENIRIVRLAPDGTILETTPMPGVFAVELVGQEANANTYTFRAGFSGMLPALDRAYAWGVLAELAMTSSDSGARPIRVTFGGTFTFEVPTVFVVDIGELAFPLGPVEEGGVAYSAWINTLPCGDSAVATIRVDSGPPMPLRFNHGCH